MGDFDPAIVVAVALAVEEETDVPRRKRANGQKNGFCSVQRLDTPNYYVN